jgi:LysR family glycine cleavage system transcriptional activator
LEPETDLFIRVADDDSADWPGFDTHPLVPTALTPLCNPSYLRQHGPIDTVETLLSRDLIDDSSGVWRDWLKDVEWGDERMESRKVFPDLAQCVASAMMGEGIVLAPRALVSQHLRLGTLVALDCIDASEVPGYYHLCWKSTDLRQNVEVVRDWLITTADRLHRGAVDDSSKELR